MGARLEEREEQIAWHVMLPRQHGEGGMQQEGKGGRKWKRRRRKTRGELSLWPSIKMFL